MRHLGFVIFLLLVTAPFASAADWKSEPTVYYGSYEAAATSAIVSFKPDAGINQILAVALPSGFQLEQLSTWAGDSLPSAQYRSLTSFKGADFSHGLVTFSPGTDLTSALEQITNNSVISEAYPNYVLRPFYTPNDPYYLEHQSNFRQIAVDKAWELGQGEGAIVAVIDSGYLTAGTSDQVENLLPGYDFWGDDTDTNDFMGHGTHVANTIAQRTNNGVGCAGIAFKASIVPCKVFPDDDGGAYESDIITAINWAVDQGVHVINMSLGGGGYVSSTSQAIQNAVDNDVVVIAATGNDGTNSVSYPARHAATIAVGATKKHAVGGNPTRAGFSQYGPGLDIVAPGSDIVQETTNGQSVGFYAYYGTSSASPHVAGVAALLVGKRGPNALLIRETLESTAFNPAGGWTETLGWGEINAYEAIANYAGPENQNPVAIATAFPTVGAPPLWVSFDATESYDLDGEIKTYRWILDSGEIISTEPTFSHLFESSETTAVTLRVFDDGGAEGLDFVEIGIKDDYTDDPCYLMVHAAYSGCNLGISNENGLSLDFEQALTQCRTNPDQEDPWGCLVTCREHEKVETCSDFLTCASDHCEANVRITSDRYNNEEESDFCGN